MSELKNTERTVLGYVQRSSFLAVLKGLRDPLPTTSKATKKALKSKGQSLYRPNPQVKDDLLVAGGRLGYAPINENTNHAIDLIIQDYHQNVGHMGQETVLTSLSSKYWIIKERSAVRRNLRQCGSCKRRKAIYQDLPSDRLTPEKPPFSQIGVDFFGPFEVDQGRSIVKQYGCIFTCLAIRAIHVEIAHSLNADSMISALRWFMAIRCCPERIGRPRNQFHSSE